MRTGRLLVAAMLSATMVACGSDGGGGDAFTEQMSDACIALRDDLRALDTIDDLTDLDLVAEVSLDAGDIYNTAVGALEKLSPDADHRDDFNELVDNMADQLDLLGDIADAADDSDDSAVTRAITKFNRLADANAKIARSAGSRTCGVASIFATDDTPTTTDPVTTDPETTDPITTDTGGGLPPITVPTSTSPAQTTSPAMPGMKYPVDVVADLSPVEGYTFMTADDEFYDTFYEMLTSIPLTNAANLDYGVVEIVVGDILLARVLDASTYDDPMPTGAYEQFTQMIAGGSDLYDATVGGINGVRFSKPGTAEYFVAGNDEWGFTVWIGSDDAALDQSVAAFVAAIGG